MSAVGTFARYKNIFFVCISTLKACVYMYAHVYEHTCVCVCVCPCTPAFYNSSLLGKTRIFRIHILVF